jgi:hypothetical protein
MAVTASRYATIPKPKTNGTQSGPASWTWHEAARDAADKRVGTPIAS